MTPDRLRGYWKGVLALYAVSFALPVDESWGVLAFVASLLWGARSPVLLVVWAANPCVWFGLDALRRGRHAAAAALGVAATACASLMLPLMVWAELVRDPGRLPWFAGYLAWWASAVVLASLGLISWLRTRPRVTIGALMGLVLAIALALTLLLPVFGVARGLTRY